MRHSAFINTLGVVLGCARLRVVAATIAILTCASCPIRSADASSSSDELYRQAAIVEGVPLDLLIAVAGAESGYHPWALNIDGQQVYCRSRAEAEGLLARHDHVAIGLMQINWQFWGPRIGLTKERLLDPATNLMIGARILKEGLGRDGSVWERISNYHSGSSHRRDKYNQLVYNSYLRYLRGEIK